MPSAPEFGVVLDAARAGDEWAFAQLFDAYHPRLLRYLTSRAGSDGDDLAGDVWLAVARRIAAFDGAEAQFRSWLFTIAHHRLVDHLTRHRRGVPLDEAAEPIVPGPEDAVADADAAQLAALRIAELLSPDQAEVVLLRVLGDLSVEQVAEVVGKRPGAVRVLAHRAIRKLAKEMSLEGVTP